MILNVAQKNALDAGMRQFNASLYTGGFSQFIQDLLNDVDSGEVGINADAWDVDALAKGGGHFAQDEDNTTGLTFAYFAGRLYNGKAIVDVAAGTVALTLSTTNYVECSRAGVVSKNTVGFTSGAIPLYTIVTGASSITTITNKKTLLSSIPNGGITADMIANGVITGTQLSTVAATVRAQAQLATVSATTDVWRLIAPCSGTLSRLSANVGTTVTTSDVDYWTFSAQYKGAAGTGTTAMLAATDANTTKTTGGSGLTSNVTRDLTLHGTGANLVVVKGELIIVTATKTASAANLVTPALAADFTFTN